MYTLQEAIKYKAWDQLSDSDVLRLMDTIEAAEDLANAVTCSDIPAAFIAEDEADEPAELLWKFEAALVNGNKAERAAAFKKLDKALRDWALQQVRTAECGMEEWGALVEIAKKVPC